MVNEPVTMVFVVFARALYSGTQVCDTVLECKPGPDFMYLSLNDQD